MNKLYFVFALFVVNLLATSELSCLQEGGKENGESENKVAKTLNPTNLELKRYSYFDIENEAFDERIEMFSIFRVSFNKKYGLW